MNPKFLVIGIILWVISVLLLAINVGNCRAADVTFSWLPNQESDLAGYAINCGTESRHYTIIVDAGLPDTVNGRVHYTVHDIPDGVYYCAASARDTSGQVGPYSNEVSSDMPPNAVLDFQAVII